LRECGLEHATEVAVQFHVNDIINHIQMVREFMQRRGSGSLCFYAGQQIVGGGKIALLAYHMKPASYLVGKETVDDDTLLVHHGSYRSVLMNSCVPVAGTCESQTHAIVSDLRIKIAKAGGRFENDVVRTWFYINGIDHNYADFAKARRLFYADIGLTRETHFITSTGIEGKSGSVQNLVLGNALAVKGLAPAQISYMKALDYMSPTYTYNVTFERGTKIVYGDRSHYFIAGTASIDKDGNVLHVGDVKKQAGRTVENIAALLNRHGSEPKDLKYIKVYLRDPADGAIIEDIIKCNFPDGMPCIVLQAAICRPAWLIEIEGFGVNASADAAYAPYM